MKCAHLGILYRGTYCTVSQSMKSRGTIFGGIAYLHDNCAVPISPSHPPAPSIAALEGAGEHFECVCVWVCVGVCGVCVHVWVRDMGVSMWVEIVLAPPLSSACCFTVDACGCTV